MSVANPKTTRFRIQVLNRQRRFEIDSHAIAALCTRVLKFAGAETGSVEITFVGARKMRQMNFRYRKKDYATDVLSFGYPGEHEDGCPFLGEIVIAPQVAREQAVRYGMSFESEIRRLVIHGLLHLLGYDHETDEGEMNRLQSRMMRRWAVAHEFPKARSCR